MIFYRSFHCPTHITGDAEKNEKIAFILLVKLLTKRTVNNPLIYVYEECLV